MCAYVIILMRAYMGVGHTDNEPAHFDSDKLTQICLVLRTGFEPLIFGSRVDALPIEPPRPSPLFVSFDDLQLAMFIFR